MSHHNSAVHWSLSLSLYMVLAWSLLASLAAAQAYDILERDGDMVLEERQNYQFTGALAIYGDGSSASNTQGSGWSGSGSSAVQAQCPADHPVSCTNIQQPYYCCPSDNTCSWANSMVACCPNGKTCSGIVGAGGGYVQTTTQYWQPTTTYNPPATSVYNGGGYVAPAATTVVGYGGYCSTLVAAGPGLPTTGAGQCGTILIVAADAVQRAVLSWTRLLAMLVGLQVVGGVLFMRR